jgi:hypothetical protein
MSATQQFQRVSTNKTYPRKTGFLPDAWASMPVLSPATTLDLSHNDLWGPILAGWGTRVAVGGPAGSGWASLSVAANPRMCGSLPAWFSSWFGANATAMSALYAGAAVRALERRRQIGCGALCA